MLTNEAISVLIEFGAKTRASIVTSKMTVEDLERLDIMLMNWKAEPTEQKEQAIISKFAIKGERNGPEPGDDY
jgi:hypothetical protein